MLTRSQNYAVLIFPQVSQVQREFPNENDEAHRKQRNKYGSIAHKLPILIRNAGLTQALAFAASRPATIQSDRFLGHLASAMGHANVGDLLSASRTQDLGEYMRLTQQALDALRWYKRFAQSILKVEESDTDEEAPE